MRAMSLSCQCSRRASTSSSRSVSVRSDGCPSAPASSHRALRSAPAAAATTASAPTANAASSSSARTSFAVACERPGVVRFGEQPQVVHQTGPTLGSARRRGAPAPSKAPVPAFGSAPARVRRRPPEARRRTRGPRRTRCGRRRAGAARTPASPPPAGSGPRDPGTRPGARAGGRTATRGPPRPPRRWSNHSRTPPVRSAIRPSSAAWRSASMDWPRPLAP